MTEVWIRIVASLWVPVAKVWPCHGEDERGYVVIEGRRYDVAWSYDGDGYFQMVDNAIVQLQQCCPTLFSQ